MIRYITAVNLQSIKYARIELPKKGLVRFRGDNSNGKSIIVKSLNEVFRGGISKPKVRRSLINYDSKYAQLIIEKYDGSLFNIHIEEEASKTYYELQIPNQEPVRRYLADKSLSQVIEDFGFHYEKNRDISLNIYNTYDPLLFVTTNGATNLEILSSALTDKQVEQAIENIDVTLKEFETFLDTQEKAKFEHEVKIASLKRYDVEKETYIKEHTLYLAENIENLSTPNIPEFKVPIDIESILLLNTSGIKQSIDKIDIRPVIFFNQLHLITPYVRTKELLDSVKRYIEIEDAIHNSKCPLCGAGVNQ